MLRIISDQNLEIDEELYACFIDWQKAPGHVKWTKLTQILKETGIDWQQRRLISKLYMDQSQSRTGSSGDKKCEVWKRS
jgi:hypothetical protein